MTAADIVPPEELVARARALVPALRARQAACEEARRVPAESVAAFQQAELFKVLQPRRHGGFEHGLQDFVDLARVIASGCGSTGWVYSVIAQHQWLIGMFAPEAQDEMWGDDAATLSASSFAPTGRAVRTGTGFRLTGRWAYCSGIDAADWLILGTQVADSDDAAPDDRGYVLMPKSDFRVEDDWHVVGLAGTGSKTAICEDVFVPAHRLLRLADAQSGAPPGAAVNPGPLWRIPFFAAISICLCAAVMGMAEGAYDEFVGATRERVTRGAALSQPVPMAGLTTIQLRIGEAAARIDTARTLVDRDCRAIMATVADGGTLDDAARIRNKGNLAFAQRLAVGAVDRLFESGGGGGLFTEGRVQRFWRDVHAGASHISINWDAIGALYGRSELGLAPGTAQF